MINVIVELSKYVILTLMVIYTFHCFYLVKQQSEEERNESLLYLKKEHMFTSGAICAKI